MNDNQPGAKRMSKFSTLTADGVVKKLKKRGYEQLGAGMYSTVLAKPGSNRVIKVGTCHTFEPYIVWATENGFAGNFAPRVFSFHQHLRFYICTIERLTQTVSQWNNKHAAWDGDRMLRADYLGSSLQTREDLESWYPGITCFCKQARKAGFCGDWHDGNWMVHEGRLVLIDPQSDNNGSGKRRWRSVATEIRAV